METHLVIDGLFHVLEVMRSKFNKGLQLDLGELFHNEPIIPGLQERGSRFASSRVPFHTPRQGLDIRIVTSSRLAQRVELLHVKDLAIQRSRSIHKGYMQAEIQRRARVVRKGDEDKVNINFTTEWKYKKNSDHN